MKRSGCEYYQAEIQKSKELTKRSKARNDIIQNLRSLLCNKADKKVCCKVQSGNPDSPDYLPEEGECGIAGDAEFIVGGNQHYCVEGLRAIVKRQLSQSGF